MRSRALETGLAIVYLNRVGGQDELAFDGSSFVMHPDGQTVVQMPDWEEALLLTDWERGPGASLRCGLQALPEQAEAAVVVLGDGPNLNPEAIDRVIATWREDKAEVVAATYAGVRLHPVLLTRSAWKRVPDEGARTLDAVLVSCDDLGPPGDVDFADEV